MMGRSDVCVVDEPDRAHALIENGGVLVRHFLRMVLDLTSALPDAPLPGGYGLEPMTITLSSEYAEVASRSYSSDHVDHQPEDDDPVATARTIETYIRGEEPGAWIPEASWHVLLANRRVAGAIVVSELARDGDDIAGPWITDIFVEPSLSGQGLGAALISRAAHELARTGRLALGLAVTVGNPARRVYERLGFEIKHENWRIGFPSNERPF